MLNAGRARRRVNEEDVKLRRLLVGEAQIRASQARYYLLESEPWERESYGVIIELEDEAAAVPDLSSSRERVQALTETLIRGGVTPIALRDIVEDWLLE